MKYTFNLHADRTDKKKARGLNEFNPSILSFSRVNNERFTPPGYRGGFGGGVVHLLFVAVICSEIERHVGLGAIQKNANVGLGDNKKNPATVNLGVGSEIRLLRFVALNDRSICCLRPVFIFVMEIGSGCRVRPCHCRSNALCKL